MVASFDGTDIRLRDLMDRFQGRVYTLFLILLCLPFCQPLALPGLSTPFGVVIAMLGIRFAVKRQPWLPARLLDLPIPAKLLLTIIKAGAKLLGAIERLLRPRASAIFDLRSTQFIGGTVIALCGVLLLLPLPVPLSNLLPALVVILVAASFSERDGVVLGLGMIFFLLTLAFFAAIFFGGAEALMWLKDYVGDYFSPGDERLPFTLPELSLLGDPAGTPPPDALP